MFDAVKIFAQHQRGNDHPCRRNAQIPGDSEQLEAGRDPGELRAGGAHVGDDERGQYCTAPPHAVPLPHKADETLPGDHAHSCSQTVENDERGGG